MMKAVKAAKEAALYAGALTTHPGFEGIAAAEIAELVGAKASTAAAGIVTFPIKNLTDLCKLCYLSQSAIAVLCMLSEFKIAATATASATAANLKKSLAPADLLPWFGKGASFKVSFEPANSSSYEIPSSEIEAAAGSVIFEAVKKATGSSPKVNLTSPDVTIAIAASKSSAFCGIAINPFDLSKREYRVFSHSSDIKGSLAYSLLRFAGYEPGTYLFDPFTRSGTIAIEAALFSSGFPVSHYRKDALLSALSRLPPFLKTDFNDFFSEVENGSESAAEKRNKSVKPKILASSSSMQHLRGAEKNAKIGGVNKLIRFSRLDIEWLDAKLDERSVDLVVSYPPQFRSTAGNDQFAVAENRKLAVLYKNFFYQADFFLKKKGRIVLLLKKGSYLKLAPSAAAYKFRPEVIKSFRIGAEEFEMVSFTK